MTHLIKDTASDRRIRLERLNAEYARRAGELARSRDREVAEFARTAWTGHMLLTSQVHDLDERCRGVEARWGPDAVRDHSHERS